jgi:simple sugar transport system substrate-binding protein
MFKNLARASVFTLVAMLAALAAPRSESQPQAALKVGFVYVSPVGDAGWTFQHDQGRLAMERALGDRVKTTVVASVPEGPDAERVLRDLANQGHGLIFATSFGYLEPALRVAAEFPGVKFEHAGGYKTAPNLNTYDARYYEGRYLAGLLAGRTTRSGTVGYVAAFPVPEVVQGINAFAIGLREANPKAQVRVLWLNSWFDPPREREAALALLDLGADVLTNHSASSAVASAAQDRKAKFIAYHSDMQRIAPDAQIGAVTHHWGGYYTNVARAVLEGRWKAEPSLGGMKDGQVQLSAISASVPAETRAFIDARRQAIEAGRHSPFAAPLVDQAGRTRLAQGVLDAAQIARMDWLVQGVVGTLPRP